jgi:hypothetical protein
VTVLGASRVHMYSSFPFVSSDAEQYALLHHHSRLSNLLSVYYELAVFLVLVLIPCDGRLRNGEKPCNATSVRHSLFVCERQLYELYAMPTAHYSKENGSILSMNRGDRLFQLLTWFRYVEERTKALVQRYNQAIPYVGERGLSFRWLANFAVNPFST